LTLLNARGYQPVELTSVMFRPLAAENAFDLRTNPQIKTRIIDRAKKALGANIGGRLVNRSRRTR
jgi:hypothetical protein